MNNDSTDPEELSESELDEHLASADHPQLGEALRALLDPESDPRSAATDNVDRHLHGGSAVSAVSALGGVGLQTIQFLLTNPPPPADLIEEDE